MEIELIRKHKNKDCTISDMLVNGAFECYILEDVDRNLFQADPIKHIQEVKVHSKTAIPYGRYEVIMSYSNRFKKYLPQLLNVPGFEGIRIHPGNTKDDTEGCLLPGTSFTDNMVANSRNAFNTLYKKLKAVEKKEKIYITIK